MLRLFPYSVPMAAIMLVIAGTATGQTVNDVFFQPSSSPASWGVGTNWSDYGSGQNIPEGQFEERAVINAGDTAQVTTQFPVGNGGETNGPGELLVQSGTLEIQNGGLLGMSEPASLGIVTRAVTINDTLNIQGGGQLTNASSITFGSGATYAIDFTTATASPLEVQGLAALGGTLDLDFSGLASPVGNHPLMSAGSYSGSFANITTTPALTSTQSVTVGVSGGILSATLTNLPTLTIDRDTGTATIENSNGTPLSLDGFSIRSPLGALDAAQFDGLSRTGWLPAGGNSSTVAADTYEGTDINSPSDSLPANSATTYQVGGAGFWSLPAPGAFLQETEELIFEFTDPSLGPQPIQGIVNYVGEKVVNNNIVLTINSAGEAVMLNQSSFPQNVEIYRITSSGSPLQTDTWTPLESQSGLDNDTWQVSTQSDAQQLLEVTEVGSSLFSSTKLYELGQILDPGFMQSGLTFEFLLEGDNEFTTGAILFGDLPEVSAALGDFNADGTVNIADYTVWRNNLGATEGSLLNGNGTGGVVDGDDYDVWKDNFGTVYAGAFATTMAAVPEPSSVALTAFALLAVVATSRGKCW